ncbi:hypothetical protein DesfrDRAFT_0749 [Solidesulfovibrio fructosivorans JJ]]|uniref:Uncharacterized protein n=1 Tax=Solidesulfovibrio fructosivorans JJ] TaxID=596151 RepID=E1JT10_SOLFR|nr:hypothetical protein [Solidesulfovibrio fructosivorans]EFL52643.1 hypothetical protein DesfrDRAFT_0749 [Solidesulfovibrio fructosivorans JJ]]
MKTFLLSLLVLAALCGTAMAREVNVNGLWRGSLYGSDLQARVEQDGHNVKAEVVVHAMTGETNVYHVVGAIFNGHMYVVHGSGHVFEGDAKGDAIRGVLTTKGGSKLELEATRVPLKPGGKSPAAAGSSASGPATKASRRPG